MEPQVKPAENKGKNYPGLNQVLASMEPQVKSAENDQVLVYQGKNDWLQWSRK